MFIARLTKWWLEGIVGRLIHTWLNRRSTLVGRVVTHLKGRRMKGCIVYGFGRRLGARMVEISILMLRMALKTVMLIVLMVNMSR